MAQGEHIAFLSVNTRGTGVYNIETGYKPTGAAVEIFEECLCDIDAWTELALSKGFTKIILEGHSFGTNKIQYYIQKGIYKTHVVALILLGFTDSYGGQIAYLKKTNRKNENILQEAQALMIQNKPLYLLSDLHINWGELPQTAQSYLNFMSPDSVLSEVLPIGQDKPLTNFRSISLPILGVVADHNECTVIPPRDAVDLLNHENHMAQCHMIPDCTHSYTGREKELISRIRQFLTKIHLDIR
jgi:pimeloyl-ACP methyl ester carboxylesterase